VYITIAHRVIVIKNIIKLLAVIFISTLLVTGPTNIAAARSIIESRVLGTSVQGRSIIATRFGTPGGKVVVVVGSIHGNEKSGMVITTTLARSKVPAGFDLWIIDTANPDGNILNWRWNAHKIDLNRNFDAFFKKTTCPSKVCSGITADSEPETLALEKFFLEIQPEMVLFYHGAVTGGVVDKARTGVATPRVLDTYGKVSKMPVYEVFCGEGECSGNATQFIYKNISTSTPFVVELPCDNGCLSKQDIARHISAFWAAAGLA
jgi:protein MpaA